MVEMRGQVDSSIEVAEQNFRDMTAQAGSQTQSALTASLKAEVNSAIFIAEVRSQAPSCIIIVIGHNEAFSAFRPNFTGALTHLLIDITGWGPPMSDVLCG